MSETLCVRCAKPLPDQAYACSACAYRAGDQLHEIADMTPAARDVAHGQARRGSGGGGSSEPRLPLNLGATQRLDDVTTRLTAWARQIAAERGTAPPWVTTYGDPLEAVSGWLSGHIEWIRHLGPTTNPAWLTAIHGPGPHDIQHPPIIAARFLGDVQRSVQVVSGIARGPGEQKFLGPCGALVGWDDDDTEVERETPCEGDVYAHVGAREGACRTCKARWATSQREAWLDGEVRGFAFRAAEIANAYGVNVNTIRSWASRPRPDTGLPPLASYWRTPGGLVTPWIDPVLEPNTEKRLAEIADEIQARGGRLHYVGDVLDLAAADAARRAGEQAKRARRAAARAAETEDAA